MDYHIRPYTASDAQAVIDIVNYYIENSFAAYPEKSVDAGFLTMLKQAIADYPFYVMEQDTTVVGFAFIRAMHRAANMVRAAEIAYFILPDHTSKGLGTSVLEQLILDAQSRGIDTLLAHISSKNERSIAFHKRQGFEECGRFRRIGRKWNEDFDMVWMQKFI